MPLDSRHVGRRSSDCVIELGNRNAPRLQRAIPGVIVADTNRDRALDAVPIIDHDVTAIVSMTDPDLSVTISCGRGQEISQAERPARDLVGRKRIEEIGPRLGSECVIDVGYDVLQAKDLAIGLDDLTLEPLQPGVERSERGGKPCHLDLLAGCLGDDASKFVQPFLNHRECAGELRKVSLLALQLRQAPLQGDKRGDQPAKLNLQIRGAISRDAAVVRQLAQDGLEPCDRVLHRRVIRGGSSPSASSATSQGGHDCAQRRRDSPRGRSSERRVLCPQTLVFLMVGKSCRRPTAIRRRSALRPREKPIQGAGPAAAASRRASRDNRDPSKRSPRNAAG